MRRRAIIGKSKVSANPNARPEGPGGFVMQIQTTTANTVFTLPTRDGYSYNATVLWGDGTQSSVIGHNINNAKTYATAGTYNIQIKGTFDAIYFNDAESKLLVKKILSWGGTEFAGFISLNSAFYGCSNLNELAEGGIKEKNGNPVTDFSYTFRNCSTLTTLPVDLFRYNTFVTDFSYTFYGCSSLTSLPATLFQYNTSVTNFSYTLRSCSILKTLPTDLFRYNTAVTTFRYIFYDCSSLTTLPTDLFRYNTLVTNFGYTFYGCSSLTTLPVDLFRYNTLVTNFGYTFRNCIKLQLRSDIFGATPNFGTRVMDFISCFNRTSFTGTQGTAPALWSATMDASSNKTTCFGGAGNNDSSIQNYTALKAANPTWF